MGVGAYTKVGIIGLGGLGHLGVLFAKALGYHHVTALSRSESKRADALALGADSYIATSDELAKGLGVATRFIARSHHKYSLRPSHAPSRLFNAFEAEGTILPGWYTRGTIAAVGYDGSGVEWHDDCF